MNKKTGGGNAPTPTPRPTPKPINEGFSRKSERTGTITSEQAPPTRPKKG